MSASKEGMEKKTEQLGMHPGTARNRLVQDLLWYYLERNGEDICFRCGEELSREDFSIEHAEEWMDSKDPKGLFFDVGNIAYSHRKCNTPRPVARDKRFNVKIRSKDIPDIEKRLSEGESLREIAEVYGVAHRTILSVKKGL